MKWKELKGDIQVANIATLFNKLDVRDGIQVLLASIYNPLIIMTESSKIDIFSHVQQSEEELGGLLIGKAYSLSYEIKHEYPFITVISNSIRSMQFENSPASLKMETEIWDRARAFFDKGKIIVGWYHSHPKLGAFFSGRDRATQKAFFQSEFSVGLVIDPFNDENKWYCGFHSKEVTPHIKIISDELYINAGL